MRVRRASDEEFGLTGTRAGNDDLSAGAVGDRRRPVLWSNALVDRQRPVIRGHGLSVGCGGRRAVGHRRFAQAATGTIWCSMTIVKPIPAARSAASAWAMSPSVVAAAHSRPGLAATGLLGG